MDTRTFEDFDKFMGSRPHRLGVVSRLYPHLTATFLTEALRNVVYGDNKKSNGFQSIDSTYFEWEIETNYIKRVPIKNVDGDGSNGTEITMTFGENYYQPQEIFKVEETGEQFFVTSRPVRKSDKDWEVTVRLIDDDYSSSITPNAYIGLTTRFIGKQLPSLKQINCWKAKVLLLC